MSELKRILFVFLFVWMCGPSRINYSITIKDRTIFPTFLDTPPKGKSFFEEIENEQYAVIVYHADASFHLDDVSAIYSVYVTQNGKTIQYNPTCDYLQLPRLICQYRNLIPGMRYSVPIKPGIYDSIGFLPREFSVPYEVLVPKLIKNIRIKENLVYDLRLTWNRENRKKKPYEPNNRILLTPSVYLIEDYISLADDSVLGILKSLKQPYKKGNIEENDKKEMERHFFESNPTTERVPYESSRW